MSGAAQARRGIGRTRGVLGVLAVAVAALLAWSFMGGVRVRAVHPEWRPVVESLAVSGQVRGVEESALAPEVQGTLKALQAEEGDRVRRGQVLALVDASVLDAQAAQAAGAVAAAEARLAQAARPPLASERDRVEAETRQAVDTAEARWREAERRLAELEAGPTAEQVRQGEERALQAEARRRQAERDLERSERLFAQDALPAQDLEKARTEHEVGRRAEGEARARLRELQKGTRPEVLSQARAQRDAARASLDGARETRRARLQALDDTPRPEDVAVAKAQVEEARDGLRVARRRTAQAEVRAPYDGLVTRRLADPGDLVGPGHPVLAMVRWPEAEIRAEADEVNLGRLAVGQRALVTSDAFPDARLEAKVSEIAPRVDPERGTVEIRVAPEAPADWLRPGQTVSVNVIFQEEAEVLVVPLPAVSAFGVQRTVLVVEGGVARERRVRVGPPGPDVYPVHEGLQESDLVIVGPPGVEPGQRVRVSGP